MVLGLFVGKGGALISKTNNPLIEDRLLWVWKISNGMNLNIKLNAKMDGLS